ncbi:MAG: hypothetical protein EAZ81_05265 [Verrucomicrobia bacterium]|nr:MAG: hypothetical protein EAZ81_05265 [Verrucomicrobiota bacterium]
MPHFFPAQIKSWVVRQRDLSAGACHQTTTEQKARGNGIVVLLRRYIAYRLNGGVLIHRAQATGIGEVNAIGKEHRRV